MDVANDIQHKVIKFLRFMIRFPASNQALLNILNLFFPKHFPGEQ